MASFDFHQFAYGNDNYGVLMHDSTSDQTAMIDAGDAQAALAAVQHTGWTLTHLLITHHHADHTAGLERIKQATGCQVSGPSGRAHPIAGIDRVLSEGDDLMFGGEAVQILYTPGHTSDMLNYWLPGQGVLFSGDTLFALGCGRLFEGDAPTMWHSLSKLATLPPQTQVYCSHEYTLANARFALSIDPDNTTLVDRARNVEARRAANEPTVPFELGLDLATNPFLRASDAAIRARLNMPAASDAQVFAELRARKDRF